MQKEKDKLACGLRFMKAISDETLNNFIIKVRDAIDPCGCRCIMVGINFPEKKHNEQAS